MARRRAASQASASWARFCSRDVAEGGDRALQLAVLRPDHAGVHVGPDVVPVLVPVQDLALERPLAQQRPPARSSRVDSGMTACSRSLLGCPIASSRVQPNNSLRRLVPEDHAVRGVEGADGVVHVGQQVRLQAERGLRPGALETWEHAHGHVAQELDLVVAPVPRLRVGDAEREGQGVLRRNGTFTQERRPTARYASAMVLGSLSVSLQTTALPSRSALTTSSET